VKILNVGGNRVQMPPQYSDWQQVLLDIDPSVMPDVLLDARDLHTALDPGQFDAVYCAHNLEHYHEHEVEWVLKGFYHVLVEDGFVDVRVPDVVAVVTEMMRSELGLDSVLYQSSVGPIRVCDVLWGYAKEIKRSGQSWFGHKTGFSQRTLGLALQRAGFRHVLMDTGHYEIKALAFKRQPAPEMLDRLGVVYEGQ
jgi:hypothetical protein